MTNTAFFLFQSRPGPVAYWGWPFGYLKDTLCNKRIDVDEYE